MTGVFYYSNSNLVLQLKFSHETDTLLYSTHRKINDVEQKSIESNIPNNLDNLEVESRTATFYYLGINPKLTQIFSLLSVIKTFESDVQLSDRSIECLIDKFNNAHQDVSSNIAIPLINN